MRDLKTIIEEIKNVPEDRLDDLYYIIQGLAANHDTAEKKTNTILSYAGSFSDMNNE